MKLQTLTLRNFKGVRDFTLTPDGNDIAVFGDNGTGKTTLCDAWNWLLFGKDSQGASDFEIKTLDQGGQPLHGLEHEVVAIIEDDRGGHIELRKCYKERWVKKRGSAQAEFSGHTTDRWIDGVPVKDAAYRSAVAHIASEDTLRLLTNPAYFADRLHWQKRREILLTVCGDVADGEVIASDSELAALPEILGSRSIDDHRKVVAARRTEINKELDRIPVRIDETQRGLPDAGSADPTAVEVELATLRAGRQALEGQRVRIEGGGEISVQRVRLREIEGELAAITRKLRAAGDDAVAGLEREARMLEEAADDKDRDAGRCRHEEAQAKAQVEQLEKRTTELRAQWAQVDAEALDMTQSETCPACGQRIPEERLREARERAEAEFNAGKSKRLSDIQTRGKALKAEAERWAEDVGACTGRADHLTQEALALRTQAQQVRAGIERARLAAHDPADDPDCARLANERLDVQAQIESLRTGNAEALAAVDAEISEVGEQIRAQEQIAAAMAQRKQGLQRIEELQRQERKLAGEYERLERETFLMERFVRTKVSLLEDRINSRFALARFKLFSEQVNGGLSECCDVTFDGVPYSSLNHGARVQVGLDIVRTLQAHYSVHAPVWIDNRESVTSLPEMDCQVFSLVVSAPDKRLRVEAAQTEAMEEVVRID